MVVPVPDSDVQNICTFLLRKPFSIKKAKLIVSELNDIKKLISGNGVSTFHLSYIIESNTF